MSVYELPDRSHLVDKEVRIELHPWARQGPRRGVFLGQGERGLSIRVPGGGRFVYRHDEVKDVREV
ncbi:hypothetical protein ACIPQA_16350 [Streptomyces sp. NPDC090109]|uniref:hypothetical protein n=1 Tax=Streptomyces sp. NPDC090109 TaxID=3365948 RepID=UPI0038240CC2